MRLIPIAILALAFSNGLDAQGKGQDNAKGQAKAKGNNSTGRLKEFDAQRARRDFKVDNIGRGNAKPDSVPRAASDNRIIVSEASGVVIETPFRRIDSDDRVRIVNRSGTVLVDRPARRDLGNWRVVTTPFQDKRGAPSFCRSGAGHPVWGRQWCVDKAFGLGADENVRWGRILDPSDVRIIQLSTGDMTRDILLGVLGEVVFNRLATQAVTLGWQDALVGRWIGDPAVAGPRVLLVSSGARPIAEIVDSDRDDRADLVLVAVRRR